MKNILFYKYLKISENIWNTKSSSSSIFLSNILPWEGLTSVVAGNILPAPDWWRQPQSRLGLRKEHVMWGLRELRGYKLDDPLAVSQQQVDNQSSLFLNDKHNKLTDLTSHQSLLLYYVITSGFELNFKKSSVQSVLLLFTKFILKLTHFI